jgi:hypothetical protein
MPLNEYMRFGRIYKDLATIFKINLDDKAGFPDGSFEKMFDDPGAAYLVLLEIGARKLDEKLFSNDPDR